VNAVVGSRIVRASFIVRVLLHGDLRGVLKARRIVSAGGMVKGHIAPGFAGSAGAALDNSTVGDGWEGMNTTEVTREQHRLQSEGRLEAHALALQAAGIIIPLAGKVPGPLKSVADQLIRASSSIALNLAEGNGRIGRDRVHHWRIAYGSALETSTALQILVSAGCIPVKRSVEAEALLDRVRAMTWRLIHPVR